MKKYQTDFMLKGSVGHFCVEIKKLRGAFELLCLVPHSLTADEGTNSRRIEERATC